MRSTVLGSRFRRDVKRMERRGKEMLKLRQVIHLLCQDEELPQNSKDHPLTGDWAGFRDCHIEPDWLLLYRIEGSDLHLVRTGTHADLFS